MAASITWPTFSPEYADATVKSTHRNSPHRTDRHVTSGTLTDGGTIGRYTSPGSSFL